MPLQVQTLNTILLTTVECRGLRARLKDLSIQVSVSYRIPCIDGLLTVPFYALGRKTKSCLCLYIGHGATTQLPHSRYVFWARPTSTQQTFCTFCM